MSKKNQHVVPNGKDWAVKGTGNDKATKIVDTQAEPIKIARQIAANQKSEVVIHRPTEKLGIKIPTELTLTLPKIKNIKK